MRGSYVFYDEEILWDLDIGLFLYDSDSAYYNCLVNDFNQTFSAELCFKNVYYADDYIYTGIIDCLESFGLPITEEDKCLYEKFPEGESLFTADDDCDSD